LLEYTTLLFDLYPSNTSEIGFASQNTPYIPSPKGRGLYGAFSVKSGKNVSWLTPDSRLLHPNQV
jgi:hypothetical protein